MKVKNLLLIPIAVLILFVCTSCAKDAHASYSVEAVTTQVTATENSEQNISFLNGRILETTGTVLVEREGNTMNAYTSMLIQSGDILTTQEDSKVSLRIDDDKYIIIEPLSKVGFSLEGDSSVAKIHLNLLAGAVYSEIENPLSSGDVYEVQTPDGVMAVRGTRFRVSIYGDDSYRITKIVVFDGAVFVQVENSQGETLYLTENLEAWIAKKDSDEPYLDGNERIIDRDSLPEDYDRLDNSDEYGLFNIPEENELLSSPTPTVNAPGKKQQAPTPTASDSTSSTSGSSTSTSSSASGEDTSQSTTVSTEESSTTTAPVKSGLLESLSFVSSDYIEVALNPEFSSEVYQYNLDIYDLYTITAVTSEADAIVEISGENIQVGDITSQSGTHTVEVKSVDYAEYTIVITVTGTDGTKQEYTINVAAPF